MKRKVGGNGARLVHHRPHNFMFATGIENSYPVVTGKDGRDLRVDEMAKCRHYERWREDFRLVKETRPRVPALRSAVLPRRTSRPAATIGTSPTRPSPNCAASGSTRSRISATSAFPTGPAISRIPIGRACSPSMPAPSRGAFPGSASTRPVNEIFVTATFSGAVRLVERAAEIGPGVRHRPQAPRQGQPAGRGGDPRGAAECPLHPERILRVLSRRMDPAAQSRAAAFNDKRFLSLDLSYGHDVRGMMYEYLMDNGMTREEYHWFLRDGRPPAPLLRHGQRLLLHQRAPRAQPTGRCSPPARYSAIT